LSRKQIIHIPGALRALLLLQVLCAPLLCRGQNSSIGLKHQLVGQSTVNFDNPLPFQFGLRYIPTLDLSNEFRNKSKLDAEVSVNAFGNALFEGLEYDQMDYGLDLYRMWIRYSTPQFEVRAGLQKISFGSATIFRPLMWFDKLDFRDPLQLTQGVYGLLARYYFKGNVNIWLWCLYGNKGTKGWEIAPTAEKKPEFGGRVQAPLFTGEIALSYHHRNADFTDFYQMLPSVESPYFNQNCLGLDGKWDVGAGIWFEYVIKHNAEENFLVKEYQHYLTLGSDYTFPLGNGLNLIAEYFSFQGNEASNYMALALNYPFGLMNRAVAAVYYHWEDKGWYRYVSLQRDYDYWSFHLIGFWNPERVPLAGAGDERNMFAGSGIQFMATVNF
jgi:hypothetical protein